jgi:hypothetical protein
MTLINQDGRDVTAETVQSVRKVISGTGVGPSGTADDLRKASGTITLATGLVAYDLEAPSKTLYPILTPIRNRIPRITRGSGAGDAAHWKSVTAIAPGGVRSMAWVPEGQRAPRMSVTVESKSAAYVTFGVEDDVTFEAQSAAAGFEDVLSTSGTRQLQQVMTLEEYAILGGNASVDLGTPVTPTLSASGSGATLPAATYSRDRRRLDVRGLLSRQPCSGRGAAAECDGYG